MENKIIKAGTKIVIGMDAGVAGTDAMEAYILVSDWTEEELGDHAWQRGKDHAESFGIYNRQDYTDCEDISEEDLDGDEYSDNIEGWWELYDEDKHAGKCMIGTQQEVHFQEL